MDKMTGKLLQYCRTLENILGQGGVTGVAFSGGVDSTFLAMAAARACPGKVIAFTAQSAFQNERDSAFAFHMAGKLEVRHEVVLVDVLSAAAILQNCSRRCYYCKYQIFSAIKATGDRLGVSRYVHGVTLDDMADTRPGMAAAEELGFQAPLVEAGFTKSMVRSAARSMGLENWDRPSQSCLATRIPTGTAIRKEDLVRVACAENYLADLGLKTVRVRCHGRLARIETMPEDMEKVLAQAGTISEHLKTQGFEHVTLDLSGRGHDFKGVEKIIDFKGGGFGSV